VDFTPGETETEAARLAALVLGAAAPSSADFDDGLWKELGHAGLLALALPADLGGENLGALATAAVLTETGRHAARIPALATLAVGVLPVARDTDPELRRRLLAGVATGESLLTAALREPSDPMPALPATVASRGTVSGVKTGVPYAAAARWILVPASTPAGTAVVVVESDAAGLSCQRTHSSAGLPEYTLRLDRTPVVAVLDGCDVTGLYELAAAGACAVADGALSAALELTTAHVRSREQFGRPLATFQAVAQQIADVYSAARTLHLATVSACWRLDTGLDAGSDTDVAAFWLAEYGPAALRTCHHLHGGLGMDISYPLPRYSALITDLVRLVGGADYRLDRLSWREQAGPEPVTPEAASA
jgi:3-oxo-4-pregnene-20-carboxyl-CoA dehydrogenase alpha subunit